jgi:chemotaxis response regulator CheB
VKRRSAGARPKQRKRGASAIRRRKIDLRNKRKTKEAFSPIVGIGGSAGGFEAAMELLRHLSPTTGMAFVIVQHLDPHHASRLPKLLSKVTAMPVVELASTRCGCARIAPSTTKSMARSSRWLSWEGRK